MIMTKNVHEFACIVSIQGRSMIIDQSHGAMAQNYTHMQNIN